MDRRMHRHAATSVPKGKEAWPADLDHSPPDRELTIGDRRNVRGSNSTRDHDQIKGRRIDREGGSDGDRATDNLERVRTNTIKYSIDG